ncbi:MAG: glycosyltransferase family 2 protein [Pseudomonadota bacterium]
MSKPPLSVVIPAFNEGGNIGRLVRETVDKLGNAVALDIIVIDDESDDDTAQELAALKDVGELRVIRHPKRSGKSAALRTGALAARADWIATMDGDAQNDPADILNMVREIDLTRVGAVGLVAGIRRKRNDGESRKMASRFANGLRQRLLRDDCPDTGCGLKLLPRDVFLAMPFFDALHRYIPAFARHLGFEVRYVSVDDRPRESGVSKYSNFGRAVAGLFDLAGVVWLMRRGSVPSKDLLFRHDDEA